MKIFKLLLAMASLVLVQPFAFTQTGDSNPTAIGTLELRALDCHKTTEAGEDEVYFMVAAIRSDGKVLTDTKRVRGGIRDGGCQPVCIGHWNMNDGSKKANTRIGPVELWRGEIALGDYVLVDVFIMEEDGGLPQEYAKLLANEAKKSDDPYVVAAAYATEFAAKVADLAKLKDSDDYIGGFTAKLTCIRDSKGKVRVRWDHKDSWKVRRGRNEGKEPNPNNNKGRKLHFNGDGASYNMVVD